MPTISSPPASRRTQVLSLACLLAPALWLQALPGRAEDCRLALVLALDESGSVSAQQDRLQREGLAAALLAPDVARAALTDGPIVLYVFEWAGASTQAPVLPGWEMIRSEPDLLRVAATIGRSQRARVHRTGLGGDGTAIGAALAFAAAALEAGPDCEARTVDVSGDGVSSEGIEPQAVLERAYGGITVNALVIDEAQADPMLDTLPGHLHLVDWFRQSVLHGPGAFCIEASGYKDYERAMTAKLRREMAPPMVSRAVTGDQDRSGEPSSPIQTG